jgi:tetratricopeptide (TPR) repeat protein
MNSDDAIAALEEAVAICQAEELLVEESRAHNNLGVILTIYAANFRAGREHYLMAGEIDRKLGDRVGELFTLTNAASSAISMGEFATAREAIDQLSSLREQVESTVASGRTFDVLLAFMDQANGQLETAIEKRREALKQAITSNSTYDVLLAAIWLSLLLVQAEAYDEAASVAQQGIDAADQLRSARAATRSILAMALARSSNAEQARSTFDEAEQIFQEHMRAWSANILRWARAEVLATEKNWDESFAAFAEAVNLYAKSGARFPRCEVLLSWAKAHLQRGEAEDLVRAKELLKEAISEFEQMGSPGYAQRIQARLEELGG